MTASHVKLLLIDPPRSGWWLLEDTVMPNLGMAYLASYLKRHLGENVEVSIVDCPAENISWRELERIIERERPDVVGVSAVTCTVNLAYKVCEMAKGVDTKILTVVGGPHPTFLPDEALSRDYIDVVVRGEGEETLKELLEKYSRCGKVVSVRGIHYREGNKVVRCPPRELIQPLDKIPPPAWDLLPMDKYKMSAWGRKVMIYVSSRGCPFRCKFCSEWVFWRGVWRAHSASRMFKDLKELVERYGKELIWFCDDTFNVDRERIVEFCNLILEYGLGVKWGIEARADLLYRDRDLVRLMSESGLFWVLLGVESPFDRDLKLMRKGVTREQVEKVVRVLKDHDIVVQGMFIVGTPDDTEESILSKAKYASKLDFDFVIFSPLTPLPGTELYQEVKKEGKLRVLDYDKYDFAHAILDTNHLSYKDVQRLMLKCYEEFYSASRVLRGLFSRNKFRRDVYWHFLKMLGIRALLS